MLASLRAVLLISVIATGLMAGLFAAFSYAVMPGLGHSSDATLVEAMQNINVSIMNPLFMVPFMGSVPLLAVAAVMSWRQGRAGFGWIAAALALYLVAFAVTSGVNVPLNDQLAAAGHSRAVVAGARADFENAWVAWNVVRALLHTAAFACLAWALQGRGADRTGITTSSTMPAMTSSVTSRP